MKKIDIICVGRISKTPFKDLSDLYAGRIKWPLEIHEIESKQQDPKRAQQEEAVKILSRVNEHAFVVVMDERGNGLKSLDFAQTLDKMKIEGQSHVQFIIGGADGLTDAVRDKASFLLSFGQQTWPHMMARIMLLEQVYRAQQILDGHPYHRE